MTQYIKRLPAVFQTVTERKFFDATVDQVFSKKDSDYLAGYLGQRIPGRYNPVSDFYIPEPSKNRTWWQLEPTAYAREADSTKSNIFFYDDLLERIEYYGGNTLNQDRLFESEYYSFGPPIDYDMFINYQSYYWVEQGLPTISITNVDITGYATLDDYIEAEIIGKATYTTQPTAIPANLTFTTGLTVIFPGSANYADPRFVENFGSCIGIKLVERFSDITAGTIFELLPWDGVIELANGRLISNLFWDATTWETQTQPSRGDYITIERGALDRNAWSRTNKWFHINAINTTLQITGDVFPSNATRALRPIIQFIADIPLFKAGTQFRSDIEYGFRDDATGNPIRLTNLQSEQLSIINSSFGIGLGDGDLVIFMNDDTPLVANFYPWDTTNWDISPFTEWDAGDLRAFNQYIFQANVQPDGSVNFAPYTSWTTPILEGDIAFIIEDGPFNGAQRGSTWYYSLGVWQQAFNDKVRLNQPPLFQLYDHNGVELNDPVTYPASTFNGSEIFSYKVNEEPGSTVDPVLRFPIVYTSLGQASDIVFQNDLIVERYTYGAARLDIDGYYYYKTTQEPILYNNWNLYQPCPCDDIVPTPTSNCLEVSKQRVIDQYVVGYGTEFQFKLSVTPFGYPADSDIIVSVNGQEVKNSAEQVDGYTLAYINNRIYVVLDSYLNVLLSTPQSQPPVVEIQTYAAWVNTTNTTDYENGLLDPAATGYYEIPQQLEANPTQLEVGEISASNLTEHFASIIENQVGFIGTAFGGNNNYRDLRKNRSVGNFILQNLAPLLKAMLVSSTNELDFILGERFSQDEYTKFKNKYLQTALQLINTGFNPVQYYNNTIVVSTWVEEILKIVNVSKEFSNAFAYSYMIANGSPFANESTIVPIGGLITLTNYVDLADPKNALYIYDVTGVERILVIGRDYEIASTNLAIDIQFNTVNVPVGTPISIALYKDALPAYIPSTPTKVGAYSVYVPRIELDTTYIVPTNVIIGHDGSKTIAYNDYRDNLLLELEIRIYNLLQYKFRNQYYVPLRVESVKAGYFRQTRYLRSEFLDITDSYLNKWSAKNRANYRTNEWASVSTQPGVIPDPYTGNIWKLYNYRDAVNALNQPLDLPGNWKGIFQYYYDTYYPDTRPWEMLGFGAEPSWWRYEYGPPVLNGAGQEVWTSTAAGNNVMWGDLEDGIIRQGPSAIYDPITLVVQAQEMWARPGLSLIIPVDTAGEIISVMTLFNVAYSGMPYSPFDTFEQDWTYGDGGPVEQAWMSTSAYAFMVQEFLYLMKPAQYGELMFDTLGTELSPGTISPGIIIALGAFTPGGSYVDGSYSNTSLIGGTGTGATANIVIAGGQVTSVTLVSPGTGYTEGDILTITISAPGLGFSVPVITIVEYPVRSTTNWQYVQNDAYTDDDPFFAWMRPRNKDQVVHAENIDGVVQIRYGYQRWISDRILFLGTDVGDVFGQKVRTLDVNLANKLAGFTNKDTTNTYIESITPGSATSGLLIPTTNFEVILHKSPPIDTYSYSGVVIRALADGTFAVYGYDLLNSEFLVLDRSTAKLIDVSIGGTPAPFLYFTSGATYNPGDIVRYNGVYYLSLVTQTVSNFESTGFQRLKALPTTGGVSVTYKPVSLTTITKIPYGTILKSVQDVFDLLIGWGAYLESRGWKFDEVSQETNQLSDWLYSAKQFLFWLNSEWAPDSSIQVSPAANKATLLVSRGYPGDVETISNGVYSILDKFGVAIAPTGTTTDRDGQLISVSPADLASGGIYFLQVNVTETEHILVFDNTTNFNDTIYAPLLRARQQRLRFNGFRSNGWYGKMEAPGYLIIDDQLVPNFDSIVEAMRYYYDPNVTIDNPSLEDLGRHLIGYESKSYLDNLQVSNDVQFLFYRGAIRQKGTSQAFEKLFRSTKVQSDEIIEVYEEWALKLSDFGNTVEQVSTEFKLQPEQNTGEVIIARLNYIPSEIGRVQQINILNAENTYVNVPSIFIPPPGASPSDPRLTEPLRQARAYAVLDSAGRISRIDITDFGYGYLEAPLIGIISGVESSALDSLFSVWQGAIINDPSLDNVIDIDIDDTIKWTVRPNDPENSLKLPTTNNIDYPLPNAGYVNFNDVDLYSFDVTQTAVEWGARSFNPVENNTLWIAKTFTEDWDVYKMIDITTPSGFEVVANEAGELLLRTDPLYLIAPQLTPPAPGTHNTDFGNMIALQVIEAQATAVIDDGEISSNATATATIIHAATATASVPTTPLPEFGEIEFITIVDAGAGYTFTPTVIISDPPAGVTATAVATVGDGVITGILITNSGSGYLVAPTVTIEDPFNVGEILKLTVVNPGSGYVSPPLVIIGGDGLGAFATPQITNGQVTGFNITSPGTGYTLASVSVGLSPQSPGAITSITIDKSGANYVAAPNVTISPPPLFPPGNIQATAEAIVAAGEISEIIITNPGSGYTIATVTIAPPTSVSGENNFTVGFEFNQTDTDIDPTHKYYTLLTLDLNPITIEDIPGYANFTKLMLFKTMRFETAPTVGGTPSYVTSNNKIWVDRSSATYPLWAVYTCNATPFVSIANSIGPGYNASADITITGGQVTSLTLGNPGGGYTDGVYTLIEFTDDVFGAGTGATVDITIVGGIVTLLTINSAGTGYTNGVYTGIAFRAFLNTIATATATAFNGTVTALTIINPGSGYIIPPVVTIALPTSLGDILQAEALATISGGQVSLLSITEPGYGYFRPFRQQEPLINTSLFENASVFGIRTAVELVRLPVYDPFKNILPGPAKQNISYTSMRDPARYNVTPDIRLFNENITFGERQVGQLWWDLSFTRYVYYEQPIALDGSETQNDNLIYRRDRWGQIFPGSTVAIFEWVQSPVPPAEYTGSGTPRDTTSYVQLITSNRFTDATEINYYFWVLNTTDIPNFENRTMPAVNVSRLLQSPRSQAFAFFAPIQQTPINNSYMFYNVQEILAYQGDNVQIEYRLDDKKTIQGYIIPERNDQEHTQWAFFREGDSNSIVTDQFWNKMVDSLCGYTKVLPLSNEFSNEIILYNDIPWDTFSWDTVPWEADAYGIILPVPDPSLSDGEKYGIEYRPRQGMFVKLQAARKVFVQSANALLQHIAIRDDNPAWNLNVTTDIYWDYTNWYAVGFENAIPTIVFQTLSQANVALTNNQLVVGDIVQVTNGTIDGRFVLYNVVQINPNISTLSLEEIAIEKSAIKLLDSVYTSLNLYGLSVELRQLLNAFRTEVMVDEFLVDQNEVFFSMINYVLSEQKNPDWVFKTSYIYIKENNQPLSQDLLYTPDQIDDVIDFIVDSKPYHTKIRDYTTTYVTTDLASGTPTDSHKINTVLTFGLDYFNPGHWDASCSGEVPPPQVPPEWGDPDWGNLLWGITTIDELPAWDILAWDICPPPPPYIVDAKTFIDNIPQFISREDVYTVPLTFYDASKVGYSQLFPFTFDFNSINLNDPQSFIAPHDIVGVQIGTEILIYGQDYYVEYNPLGETYTVYFYNDPGISPVPVALVWYNGGALLNVRYNAIRSEIARGIASDGIVVNVDTKRPLSNNNILSITYVGNVATLTTTAPHGIPVTPQYWAIIPGVSPLEYNGTYPITVTGPTTFTYTMADVPPTNATIVGTYYLLADETISFKANTNYNDGKNFYRNADAYAGTLVNALLAPVDETFNDIIPTVQYTYNVQTITVTAASDIFPDPTSLAPGVIWIKGERIEYRLKNLIAANTWDLSFVRRGTMGTAATDHSISSKVWVESGNYMPPNSDIEVWNAIDANSVPNIVPPGPYPPDPTPSFPPEFLPPYPPNWWLPPVYPPGTYTNITSVPADGLWGASTTQAIFLKNSPGESIP